MADEGEAPRGRVIAEFSDYDQLINGLRLRAAELNVSGEALDARAGLASKYSQKLLGQQQVRRIGAVSMRPFFGALGVRCLIVEDTPAEQLRNSIEPRNGSYVRPSQTYVIVTNRKWARIQKLGQEARRAIWGKLTPQQRSNMMRALTLKRWRRLSKEERSELMRALVRKRWKKGAS